MTSNKYFICVTLMLASCGPGWDVRKETPTQYAASNTQSQQAPEEASGSSQPFTIVIFDVGQGSAALVSAPTGEAAVIDAGPPESGRGKIVPYLDSHKELNLEYIFVSHGDSDHAGGVSEVVAAFPPEKGVKDLTNTMAGEEFELGEVVISVLAANCEFNDGTRADCEPDDDNAHSMALRVAYKEFTYLTLGDLPGGGGEPPYQTIDLEGRVAELAGDVDVLHVGHHGSNTSTNQTLLDLTTPETAVISVGNNNDYWHPHPTAVERLLNAGIEVYLTERGRLREEFLSDVVIADGDIVVESDGDNYETSF